MRTRARSDKYLYWQRFTWLIRDGRVMRVSLLIQLFINKPKKGILMSRHSLKVLAAAALAVCGTQSAMAQSAALIAAAKAEGQLTTIALPHDWCGYGLSLIHI